MRSSLIRILSILTTALLLLSSFLCLSLFIGFHLTRLPPPTDPLLSPDSHLSPLSPSQARFFQLTTTDQLTFSAVEISPDQSNGHVVLFVHGFPDDYLSFSSQMRYLAERKFRVVSVSLRGYETSSQPKSKEYDLASLAGDVIAWMDAMQIEKVHLVGHDWGAVIGRIAVGFSPSRFHSFVSLSIPSQLNTFWLSPVQVPTQLFNSWYMLFFQLPVLPEWWLRQDGNFRGMAFLWRAWSFRYSPAMLEHVRQTFTQPQVMESALEYYRQNIFQVFVLPRSEQQRRVYSTLQQVVHVPTFYITGALDGCLNVDMFRKRFNASEFASDVDLKIVDSAGHFVHHEQAEVVSGLLLDWLNKFL